MMLFPTRSPIGALAWVMVILSLACGGGAFVVRGRSLNTRQSSTPRKHEVKAGSLESAWVGGLLPRALAIRGGSGTVQQVATQAELEEIISNSGDALVCIDFTATWCSPCQQIAPAVEQLSQELTNVVFLKVDVDENEETAQKYEVFQMPTFLLMRKGEVVEQFSGANAAVLRQKVEALLGNAEGGSEAGDEGEDVGEVGEEKPDGEVEEEKPNFEGVCEPEVEDNAADSEA